MKEETRYIFSTGELTRKDHSICFKHEKGNLYLPIKDTKELYCFEDITISTKVLNLFSKTGIILHFFDYYGHYSGTFYPREYLLSGNLTVKQAQTYLDMERRLHIAKAIVQGIASNMHTILYHYYRHGKTEIKPFLDWLKQDVPNLMTSVQNIKQLLMVEGTIWSRFYQIFPIFLPEDFILYKRIKRPPDNPINALISFGNSLLYTKTLSQIYHTHLNPTISFLHEPSESRFSLCLDLCEVFKPIIVFKTIFECVNNRKLMVGRHFKKDLNYCILNEAGRKIFIQSFENRLNEVFQHPKLKRKVTYKQAIRLDAYKLIKFILEDKSFVPFELEGKM